MVLPEVWSCFFKLRLDRKQLCGSEPVEVCAAVAAGMKHDPEMRVFTLHQQVKWCKDTADYPTNIKSEKSEYNISHKLEDLLVFCYVCEDQLVFTQSSVIINNFGSPGYPLLGETEVLKWPLSFWVSGFMSYSWKINWFPGDSR